MADINYNWFSTTACMAAQGSATLNADWQLRVSSSGSYNSGRRRLGALSLSSFSIGGFASIGPYVYIDYQTTGSWSATVVGTAGFDAYAGFRTVKNLVGNTNACGSSSFTSPYVRSHAANYNGAINGNLNVDVMTGAGMSVKVPGWSASADADVRGSAQITLVRNTGCRSRWNLQIYAFAQALLEVGINNGFATLTSSAKTLIQNFCI